VTAATFKIAFGVSAHALVYPQVQVSSVAPTFFGSHFATSCLRMKYSIPGLKQSDFSVTKSVVNKRQRLSTSANLVCALEDQHNCRISHVQGLGQD